MNFVSILSDIRTPGVYAEIDPSRALKGASAVPQKALVVGQKLTAGEATADSLVSITSPDEAERLGGHGSQLAHIATAFKKINPYVELFGVALADNPAGAAAAGAITFAGTATRAGSIVTRIGGEKVETAVAVGDTAAEVCTAVVAAWVAKLKKTNLPVVCAVDGVTAEKMNVTCLHKGTMGNSITIKVNFDGEGELPAGITSASVTAMSAGSGDPDMADAITAMADEWYNTIISGLNDDTNLDLLEAELVTRFDGMHMQPGVVFSGAYGNLGAMSSAGNARNSPHGVLAGGGLSPTPPWIWAADAAAIDSLQCMKDPSVNRRGDVLTNCVAPARSDRFTREERDVLLRDGVATYTVSQDGRCVVERMVTTYQTNTLGNPDVTFLDVMTPRIAEAMQYTARVWFSKFAKFKLSTSNTVPPGQNIFTPAVGESEALALHDFWVRKGWAIGGSDAIEAFKAAMVWEFPDDDVNRVNFLLAPEFIKQCMVMGAQLQFIL